MYRKLLIGENKREREYDVCSLTKVILMDNIFDFSTFRVVLGSVLQEGSKNRIIEISS